MSLLIQTKRLFHWRKCYYELCTLVLAPQDINWWTGVLWIIVMFVSDSHSDGTHSLQSIHCWASDAKFLQTWWRNKLIYILDGLRMKFSWHFLVNYSLQVNFRGNIHWKASHRAERLPKPSFLATPCSIFTGFCPGSPILPLLPFFPDLVFLALGSSASWVLAGRERYTSRAERFSSPRACRLCISCCCCGSERGMMGRVPWTSILQESV